jgi:hypothetical protein
MDLGKVVRCFGKPKSVVVPSPVREIGENAFAQIYSLVDLIFEEGVERIKFSAFYGCSALKGVVFPASLVVIDERAFGDCEQLREVAFAADSKLQSIGKEAFSECPLVRVSLPESVTEIDPSAFSDEVWKIVKSEGPPLLLMIEAFLCSPDSRTMVRYLFRLRLSRITVPSSIEILGDRCFDGCPNLETVTFLKKSKLKKIGERAFACCPIRSFTIPASVNEIDGSAFVGCPLQEINLDPGNLRYIVRGKALLTSDGTEIVRSFGFERHVFVAKEIEVLGKSCFESFKFLLELKFESGSTLRKIGRSVLSGCKLLRSIVVPASVTEIEESAFKKCCNLEYCLLDRNAMRVGIGREAFAECSSLRSFYVPRTVEAIGENCFKRCPYFSRHRFGSRDTLKRTMSDMRLDEALERLGVAEISGLFRIELEDDVSALSFPGWVPVADESSHLTLVRHFS